MHLKNIKAQVRKQLKSNFPNWHRLTKKEKKEIANKVFDEVSADYDYSEEIKTSKPELLGLSGQELTQGIMSIEQMADFVESCHTGCLFKLQRQHTHPAINDIELQRIDSLIDDRVINRRLAPEGYTPASRDLFPCNMLRAEILKAVKYPEISYRKFCGDDKHYENHKETSPYIGMDCKQNRAFIGLHLLRREMISHVQMAQFRSSLTYTQLVNLNVYFLHLLHQQGMLDPFKVHCIDSTELSVDRHHLLAKLEIG